MGFSFSGLSLVTTTAAELGAGGAAQNGAAPQRPGSKAFFNAGETVSETEDASPDVTPDPPATALCFSPDNTFTQASDAGASIPLFSALWTSAVGISETQPESTGSDSPSILESEPLLSGAGASPGRSAARSDTDGRGSSSERHASQALLLRDAVVLRQPAPTEPVPAVQPVADLAVLPQMRDAGPAFAVKAAASSAVDSITAEISGSEVDSSLANPAGRQDLNFENSAATIPAPRNAPERAEDVASLLAEFVPEKSASARGRKDTRMPGNAEPETGRMESGEQAGDRNRNATPGGTVNLPPGMAPIEKSSTPAPAASVVVPRPAAAHRISLQSLLNESAGSLRVENSTPQPTPTAPRSEIAFQAEILLSNRQPAAEASLANVAPEPAVRLRSHAAGPDGAPHSTAGPVQQTEAKITARPAELAPAAIIAAEEHAGTSAVQPSQEHASTHPDRGMHQTPSFAPANWMAPRAGSEPAPATRTAAVPSAAQLDFAAPAETGHAARSVALNFQSEDHGSANVILTDRGGQVHVTVRSSDPALTQSLRSDLSTLAGGLQQHGFDFKLWSPSSSGPAGAEARVHSNDMSDPGDFHGQTSDRQPPDDNNPRHRRQNEWSEELD